VLVCLYERRWVLVECYRGMFAPSLPRFDATAHYRKAALELPESLGARPTSH
jgi:hypothetical protein